MVTYGMSKVATHHLVASTAYVVYICYHIIESSNKDLLNLTFCRPKLPASAVALGILPITIDTPMNRKYMGDADFSSWTKVCSCILE